MRLSLFRTAIVDASRARLLRATATALGSGTIAIAATMPAQAQVMTRDYDLPAQPLASAVTALGQQSGVQIVSPGDLLAGRTSSAVRGKYSRTEALVRMLEGTGLAFRINGSTIILEAGPTIAGDALQTSMVQVEGRDGNGMASPINGVNGSHDVTATEHSGSYTTGAVTVGDKVPTSIKDTPATVSVITQQQIQDQNINDFRTLMDNLPGISVVTGSNGALSPEFYSRGFRVSRLQVDGGAPIDIGGQAGSLQPQLDVGLYDHVELLRGADGLFNGYGSPGGAVNLVRKRPLAQQQFSFEAEYGSWDRWRANVDLTGPITADGKLRARVIAIVDQQNYFYRIARTEKMILSAALDYEVVPGTVVSGGATKTLIDAVPWQSGLPRFLNGEDLDLPRSTCLCVPWSQQKFNTTELYARVDSAIAKGWNVRLNATRMVQNATSNVGVVSGVLVGPNRDGDSVFYATGQSRDPTITTGVDGSVSGNFTLLGNQQTILLGANYSKMDANGLEFFSGGFGEPVNIFAFDPYSPQFAPPTTRQLANLRFPVYAREQYGAYATLKLTPLKPLHLMVGTRYSRSDTTILQQQICTQPTCFRFNLVDGQFVSTPVGSLGDIVSETRPTQGAVTNLLWPPVYSASLDVTKSLSVYGTYQAIFQEQLGLTTVDGKPFGPVRGRNIEGGVKWAPNGGRLNVNLSGFSARQSNFAERLDRVGSSPIAQATSRTLVSRGFDFQVAGEIVPGWQAQASYNFNDSYERSSATDPKGPPLVTRAPRHLATLWTTYQFANGGKLKGLSIGGGAKYRSSGYFTGVVCTQVVGNQCEDYGASFEFVNPAYLILSARVGYQIRDNIIVSINADNLLDKKYYETVGTTTGGNWYGEPRRVLMNVSTRF